MFNGNKKEFWQHHINCSAKSEMTQREYCRTNDLAISTFGYWKRKLDAKQDSATRFYPLIVPEQPEEESGSELKIRFENRQFFIEVGKSFSERSLQKLVTTLGQL